MFDKVLVANRGEIAVRVIHACRELGIRAVAVYSEPDRLAPHVLLADEAVEIGPAAAAESYLSVERLLAAASRTGAEAIHPGYGFLAENPDFARAVERAGLVFVGPPPSAMQAMGDKTEARRRMQEVGIRVVPGSETVEDLAAARRAAEEVGYPVILKAAAGGGGKGMRAVNGAAELEAAFPRAESEARQAFGDGRLYLERYLPSPRHIEIQLLADAHGTTVHLGERECSIQRRHQKLVEEAPSPIVDAELRARMGAVAIRAAEAVGYRNAGTVEFLYEGGEFFFLEMNTRLQVEHPVTELVTGVDLVAEQLRIAAGEPLRWAPSLEWPRGHAIECRLSAEDPAAGFLPAVGRVQRLRVPGGPGVRWESGIVEGFEVGLSYDPLLAKLVVHGESREAAIARMHRALRELRIAGVATTQPFHLAVMQEPDFLAGRLSVRYLEDHPSLSSEAPEEAVEEAVAAAVALLEEERRHGMGQDPGRSEERGRASDVRPGLLTAWQRASWAEPRRGPRVR
ncbi:MAG: acetyl/propionyl/methylcrotonyl-CoA carboxylase subunit alpha [Gemmatimonadota bacterium]